MQILRRRTTILLYLALALLAAVHAKADITTDYSFVFTSTVGGVAPTSTTFTLDSTTNVITNFTINWAGTTFNLGSSGGAYWDTGITATDSCFPALGNAGGVAAFTTSVQSCVTTVWKINPIGNYDYIDFIVEDAAGSYAEFAQQYYCGSSGCPANPPYSHGTFETVTTPEPASGILLVGVAMFMARFARRTISSK